jgi:cation transport ATPase
MTIILCDPLFAKGEAMEKVFIVLGEGIQLLFGEFLKREGDVFYSFQMLVLFFVLLGKLLEHLV